MYSNTMYTDPARLVMISCRRMTFSCRSDCSSLISRIDVTGKPSLTASMRIFLSATSEPVRSALALYTWP